MARCCECKCTDERACAGGCAWAEPGLCTRCVAVHGLRKMRQTYRAAATRQYKIAADAGASPAGADAEARAKVFDRASDDVEQLLMRSIAARNGETELRIRKVASRG